MSEIFESIAKQHPDAVVKINGDQAACQVIIKSTFSAGGESVLEIRVE